MACFLAFTYTCGFNFLTKYIKTDNLMNSFIKIFSTICKISEIEKKRQVVSDGMGSDLEIILKDPHSGYSTKRGILTVIVCCLHF